MIRVVSLSLLAACLLVSPVWAVETGSGATLGTWRCFERIEQDMYDSAVPGQLAAWCPGLWAQGNDARQGANTAAYTANSDMWQLVYSNLGYDIRSRFDNKADFSKVLDVMFAEYADGELFFMHDDDGFRISTYNTHDDGDCNPNSIGTQGPNEANAGPCATLRGKGQMCDGSTGTTTLEACNADTDCDNYAGGETCVEASVCSFDGLTFCEGDGDCTGVDNVCQPGYGVINPRSCMDCRFLTDKANDDFLAFTTQYMQDIRNGNVEGDDGDLADWRTAGYYGYCERSTADRVDGVCIGGPHDGTGGTQAPGDCSEDNHCDNAATCPAGVCRCSQTLLNEYPHNDDGISGRLCNKDNICVGGTYAGEYCNNDYDTSGKNQTGACDVGGGSCTSAGTGTDGCVTGEMCLGAGGYGEVPIGGAGPATSPPRDQPINGIVQDNFVVYDNDWNTTFTHPGAGDGSTLWNLAVGYQTDCSGGGNESANDALCPGDLTCCDGLGDDSLCTLAKHCMDADDDLTCDVVCYGQADADTYGAENAIYIEAVNTAMDAIGPSLVVHNGCYANVFEQVDTAVRWMQGLNFGQAGTGYDGCMTEGLIQWKDGGIRTAVSTCDGGDNDGLSCNEPSDCAAGGGFCDTEVHSQMEQLQRIPLYGFHIPLNSGIGAFSDGSEPAGNAYNNITYDHERMVRVGTAAVLIGCPWNDPTRCHAGPWDSAFNSHTMNSNFTTDFPYYDDYMGAPADGYYTYCTEPCSVDADCGTGETCSSSVCSISEYVGCWGVDQGGDDESYCEALVGANSECLGQNFTFDSSSSLYSREFTGGWAHYCAGTSSCSWAPGASPEQWLYPDEVNNLTQITTNPTAKVCSGNISISCNAATNGTCSGGVCVGGSLAGESCTQGSALCFDNGNNNCMCSADYWCNYYNGGTADWGGCVARSRPSWSSPNLTIPQRDAAVFHLDRTSGDFCGDGVTEGAEECDDGLANYNLVPDACRLDCTDPRCGDWVVDSGEDCDDGNTTNGDGCSSLCQTETSGDKTLTGGTATGTDF